MSLASRLLLFALLLAPAAAWAAPLRVCADPNNMPYSNSQAQGFENEIAKLVAADLGRDGVQYTWWPQRRGFIRQTLKAKKCDVVIGVPVGYELTDTTKPYYRSSFAFITRAGEAPIRSFDDPRLAHMKIGLHALSGDYPPAQALAMRGLMKNVRAYSIYGDYSKPDPTRNLVDALAKGEVDVAIAWGPVAGYFASKEPVPLTVTPIAAPGGKLAPMQWGIAMGVRHGDAALRDALQASLERHRAEIRRVLLSYGVPLL